MPTVDEPNDRLRNEIEEILAAEDRKSREPIRIVNPVKPRRVRVGTPWWMPTPEKLIVMGIVVLITGAIIRHFVLPLTIAGFALSGIGYYMLVRRKRAARTGRVNRSSGGTEQKYWRGRPVEPPKVKTIEGNVVEFPDSFKNKVRRKFGGKR
jgi:hypothetical protein